MKLRFTARAARDLADIADYIRARDPSAALRVRAAIIETMRNLILFPEAGRQQNLQGVRKLVMRGYPYIIYYSSGRECVTILSIRHAARHRAHSDI